LGGYLFVVVGSSSVTRCISFFSCVCRLSYCSGGRAGLRRDRYRQGGTVRNRKYNANRTSRARRDGKEGNEASKERQDYLQAVKLIESRNACESFSLFVSARVRERKTDRITLKTYQLLRRFPSKQRILFVPA